MKARSAIAKGRKYQKEIAEIQLGFLQRFFPESNFDETHVHPQISACAGSDIVMTTEVKRLFPFDVECKKGDSTTLEAAYRQSARRTPKGLRPLVVMSHNRKPSCVFLTENDFDYFRAGGICFHDMLDPSATYDYHHIFRNRRNKERLYDVWLNEYKLNKKNSAYDEVMIFSTNPLIDNGIERFVQLEFTHFLELWFSFCVKTLNEDPENYPA